MHLSRGFISLSGLQFRGHAFFSDKDVPLGADTIEYAWLTEIQCGSITGKITLPQVLAKVLNQCLSHRFMYKVFNDRFHLKNDLANHLFRDCKQFHFLDTVDKKLKPSFTIEAGFFTTTIAKTIETTIM